MCTKLSSGLASHNQKDSCPSFDVKGVLPFGQGLTSSRGGINPELFYLCHFLEKEMKANGK